MQKKTFYLVSGEAVNYRPRLCKIEEIEKIDESEFWLCKIEPPFSNKTYSAIHQEIDTIYLRPTKVLDWASSGMSKETIHAQLYLWNDSKILKSVYKGLPPTEFSYWDRCILLDNMEQALMCMKGMGFKEKFGDDISESEIPKEKTPTSKNQSAPNQLGLPLKKHEF